MDWDWGVGVRHVDAGECGFVVAWREAVVWW